MDPPGKFMSVRGTNGPSWKIIKKVAPEKKEQIFSKTVSVAASEFISTFESTTVLYYYYQSQ